MPRKLILFLFMLLIGALSVYALDGSEISSAGTAAVTIGGAEFIKIPAGEFSMGRVSGDGGTDELPVHQVYVDSFYMGKYEVTLAQFQAFITDSGYQTQGEWNGEGADYPVAGVSWKDANAYCTWFSRKYGVTVRLPTEAEWEKAARGGHIGEKYPNGDTISRTDANFHNEGPAKAGSYPPNGYGLYDMAGNVWEWCSDCYGKDYYKQSPYRNPKGPEGGPVRVNRGGSWMNSTQELRCAFRNYNSPGSGYSDLGFRLVLTDV